MLKSLETFTKVFYNLGWAVLIISILLAALLHIEEMAALFISVIIALSGLFSAIMMWGMSFLMGVVADIRKNVAP